MQSLSIILFLLVLRWLPEDAAAFAPRPWPPAPPHRCGTGAAPSATTGPGRRRERAVLSAPYLPPQSSMDRRLRSLDAGGRIGTRLAAVQKPPTDGGRAAAAATDDDAFPWRTALGYLLGQSSLILLAVLVSLAAHTPNLGLGPVATFDAAAVRAGLLAALPLAGLAALPELLGLEDRVPALREVTRATLRAVRDLLGAAWRPGPALLVCLLLGLSAGLGEEMLFRGLLQSELTDGGSSGAPLLQLPAGAAIALSSLLFGALHAATPLYSVLAGFASVYFGLLYAGSGYNLAVPVVCHTAYDVGALLVAHWAVTRGLSAAERDAL